MVSTTGQAYIVLPSPICLLSTFPSAWLHRLCYLHPSFKPAFLSGFLGQESFCTSSGWWGYTSPLTLLVQVSFSPNKQQQKRPNPELHRNVTIKTEIPLGAREYGGRVSDPSNPGSGAYLQVMSLTQREFEFTVEQCPWSGK